MLPLNSPPHGGCLQTERQSGRMIAPGLRMSSGCFAYGAEAGRAAPDLEEEEAAAVPAGPPPAPEVTNVMVRRAGGILSHRMSQQQQQ